MTGVKDVLGDGHGVAQDIVESPVIGQGCHIRVARLSIRPEFSSVRFIWHQCWKIDLNILSRPNPSQQAEAQQCTPSIASRARLAAAAKKEKSCLTRSHPRTRALRPPCLRRIRCPIFRSTFGRVAR